VVLLTVLVLESSLGGIEDSAYVSIVLTSIPVFAAAALLNAALVRSRTHFAAAIG